MERRQLEYFVAVVEYRGFTKAARALHVAQPTLSRAVGLLEDELGTLLFQRTPTGIVVTEAAENLMRRARGILHDIEGFRVAARTSATDLAGTVEVALTAGPAIEPMTSIVAELQRRRPRVRTIGIPQASTSMALQSVTAGNVQVAIFGNPSRPVVSRLSVHQVHVEETVIAIPPGSVLAGPGRILREALIGHAFIAPPHGTVLRDIFDRLSADLGGLRVSAEVSHREAVLPMVARGIGIGLLPGSWKHLVRPREGTLRALEPAMVIPTWLVHRPQLEPTGKAFVDIALDLSVNVDEW